MHVPGPAKLAQVPAAKLTPTPCRATGMPTQVPPATGHSNTVIVALNGPATVG